jgi:hypothetical protein
MLGLSLDNLLFFLLVAVAALFQLLSKAVSKSRKRDSGQTTGAPPPTGGPIQPVPVESDPDRIRKFLEALGQPATSTPPRPVLPRRDIPPRPVAPVQPPPVNVPGGFRLPHDRRQKRGSTKEQSRPAKGSTNLEQNVPTPGSALPSAAFEVHKQLPVEVQQPPLMRPNVDAPSTVSHVPSRGALNTNIAALLASNSTLQEAVLLCEILGTPRGLQPLDHTL